MAFIAPLLASALSAPSTLPTLKDLKITPDVELRGRFERRVDKDFVRSLNDNRSDFLWRVRPGVTATAKNWNARIQLQYAHTVSWTEAKNFSAENPNVSLAYAQFNAGEGKLTVGRQKITLGDERLIGTLEWQNVARSMDGIRYQDKDWDASAFEFGVAFNRPVNARVLAVSHKNPLGTTSYILKSDETSAGDVTVHTLDHVWKGKLGKDLNGEFEIAGQMGKVGPRDLGAIAAHARATYAFDKKFSLGLEGNIATGGQSANHSKTFDNLYPTNHKFYGSADMQGWRNMQELSLHASYKTDPNGTLLLAWHNFWLFDATDAWYGATGGINPRPGGTYVDPTGASGRHVGSEIDITYNRKLGANGSSSIGFAVFRPGGFVKNLNPAQDRLQYWGYWMVNYKF
ncbi:MAG: alginate export family protein [Chthonomonas sp.]|nr:alginate export family protein [Chthonomonas sp.]